MPNGQSGGYPPGVAGSPIEPEKIAALPAEKNKIFFKGPTPIPQPLGVQALEEFNRQGGNLGDLENRRLRIREDDPSVRALAKLIEPDRLNLLQKYGYDEDFITELNTNIENATSGGSFRGYPAFSSLSVFEKLSGFSSLFNQKIGDPVRRRSKDFLDIHTGFLSGANAHLRGLNDGDAFKDSVRTGAPNPYLRELIDKETLDKQGVPEKTVKLRGVEQGAGLMEFLAPNLSYMFRHDYAMKPLDWAMVLPFSHDIGQALRLIGPVAARTTAALPVGSLFPFLKPLLQRSGRAIKQPGAVKTPVAPVEATVKATVKATNEANALQRLQLGQLKPVEDIIEETTKVASPRQGVGGVFDTTKKKFVRAYSPSSAMENTGEQLKVVKSIHAEEAKTKINMLEVVLRKHGTEEQLFGPFDKVTGLITKGKLRGLHLNDIRSNPDLFDLSVKQRKWIDVFNIQDADIIGLGRANGLLIGEIPLKKGQHYAGRRLLAKPNLRIGDIDDYKVVNLGRVTRGPAPAEMARVIPTGEVANAIKAGYLYQTETVARALNVQALYRRISEEMIKNYVVETIPSVSMGTPQVLATAKIAATTALKEANLYLASAQKATMGKSIPIEDLVNLGQIFKRVKHKLPERSRTLLREILNRGTRHQKSAQSKLHTEFADIPVEYRPPVQKLIEKKSSFPRKLKEQDVALRQLKAEAELLKKESANELAVAKLNIRESKKAARQVIAMERKSGRKEVVIEPFSGEEGRVFIGEEAQSIADALQVEAARKGLAWGGLRAWSEVNAVGRLFKLTYDISAHLIQMFFVTAYAPKVAGQSFRWAMQALVDPKAFSRFMARGTHLQTAQNSHRLILTAGGAGEFTEALARGGWLQRLGKTVTIGDRPITIRATTPLEPFQRGFETALDVAGILLKEGLVQAKHSAAEVASIENFINNVRGLTSSSAVGVGVAQRAIEAAVLLAPRYNRAVLALMADIVRGFAGKGGLQGKMARDAFVKTTVGFMAAYVGIAKAMGQKPIVNPLDTNFMTVEVAGQRIGPGPKILSHLRFLSGLMAFPDSIDELTVRHPVFRYMRGQLAVTGSSAIDLLTGRDYIGQKTREGYFQIGETMLKNFMIPIWLESVIFEGGSIGAKVTRGITDFVGARSRPVYLDERMDDLVMAESINKRGQPVAPGSPEQVKKFEDLLPQAKIAFKNQEEIIEIRDQYKKGTDWELLEEVKDRAFGTQQRRDEALIDVRMSGRDWRASLIDAAIESSARADVLILLGIIETKGPKNDNEKALQEYYNLQETFVDEALNKYDVQGFSDARLDFLQEKTEEQRAYIIDHLHPNATELVLDFYKFRYELTKKGWWKLHESDPLYKGVKKWYDWIKNQERIDPELGRAAKIKFPVAAELVKKIDRNVAARQRELIQGDIDLDVNLALFYDRVPKTAEAKAKVLLAGRRFSELQFLTKGPDGDRLSLLEIQQLRQAGFDNLVEIVSAPEIFKFGRDPYGLWEQAFEILNAMETLEAT